VLAGDLLPFVRERGVDLALHLAVDEALARWRSFGSITRR
jgi:hypothetical protein